MSKSLHNKYCYYFFCCFLLELFLGGSGQEIHITGFLTLRMINFLVGFFIGLIYLIKSRYIPVFVTSLLFCFIMLASISIAMGILNNVSLEYLFEDIKPLSYFFIIVFLYYMINSSDMASRTYQILLISGKILVTLYLIYILLTDILGIFDFSWAYSTFESDSFLFRGIGSAFYYKGFVFVPIAAIGFLIDRKYMWFLLSAIAV